MHDLPAVDPDIELAAHDVDVGGGIPVGAGVRAVRIAEGDVNAGIFSSCRMLPITSRTAMLVPMANSPTRSLFSSVWQYAQNSSRSSLFGDSALDEPAALDLDGERRLAQVAVLLAEVIADHAIDHEDAVHRSSGVVNVSPPGRLPHLFGLMMPLVFSHFKLRRETRDDVGAGGVGGADLARLAGHAARPAC